MALRGAPNLAPYEDVLKLCSDRGWTTHLSWGPDGWRLELRDQGDLIAVGTSTAKRPDCFREAATNAAVCLSRLGLA